VGSTLTVTMRNGESVQGVVVSSGAEAMTLKSVSFGDISIVLGNVATVSPCPAVPSGAIVSTTAQPSTTAAPKIRLYGLAALTVSMGFTGSASRDQTYSANPKFYDYERAGKARTTLNLSASYDDKWKATANSSNVTQVYAGQLQQLFILGGTGAVVASGNAYKNNSQGIILDQEYGFGGLKTFSFPKKNLYVETDFDLRAIHDEMNAPGPTVTLVGSNLSASLSKSYFAPKPASAPATALPTELASIVIKVGAVPVFNRADSWQTYGTFDANRQLSSMWSVGLNVVDNYFEIAPKGYDKNYLKTTVSLKFTPKSSPSGK
jgi:hypothetical protein